MDQLRRPINTNLYTVAKNCKADQHVTRISNYTRSNRRIWASNIRRSKKKGTKFMLLCVGDCQKCVCCFVCERSLNFPLQTRGLSRCIGVHILWRRPASGRHLFSAQARKQAQNTNTNNATANMSQISCLRRPAVGKNCMFLIQNRNPDMATMAMAVMARVKMNNELCADRGVVCETMFVLFFLIIAYSHIQT